MKVKVNHKYLFDLSDAESLDISKGTDGSYNLIYQNQSYTIQPELVKNSKEFSVSIDGRSFDISISDHYDILIDKLGFALSPVTVFSDIKAPMPGLVLEIMVQPGDQVVEGDALIVLEAMKMENIIKAPGDGIVKSINVKPHDAIEKNTILIEME